MRILIVTDSYPPELRSAAQLMADLAEGLVPHGHDVTVATTFPGYNLASGTTGADVPEEEVLNGVRVVRVDVPAHHRVNYVVRGINQILLPRIFLSAVSKKISGSFDRVIVHSPPLPLALAAARFSKHYGATFVANVHDIFPQNGIDLVSWWQKPLIRIAFEGMERSVYRSADIIVVPSENHAQYLRDKRGVSSTKLHVIPHWIDAGPYDAAMPSGRFRKAWGLEGKFVFFFGGVLGPSQGLDMILDAADFLRSVSDVRFLFVGDGTARLRLERIVTERKLGNVLFRPFVTSKDYAELVKEMDVCVATLTSKNTTPAVPAKLMGYMAAGAPVVVAVHRESDAIRIVEEAKCGFATVSDSSQKVRAAFKNALDQRAQLPNLGANGRRYLEENFSKTKLILEWDRVLGAI